MLAIKNIFRGRPLQYIFKLQNSLQHGWFGCQNITNYIFELPFTMLGS